MEKDSATIMDGNEKLLNIKNLPEETVERCGLAIKNGDGLSVLTLRT